MNKHALFLKPQVFIALGLMMLLLLGTEPSFASSTSGGGLPFDSWLTKSVIPLQDLLPSPFLL
ncbi:hypothetical protein FOLKNPGA_03694 (plasmid) [Legionella sp. PC1000]|nr:hypothetical protein FOLKNPGA_03694 [Legionella sp. PC1000]